MEERFPFRPEYGIPELWEEIASHCTPQTLWSLSLVNRRMVNPAQRHLFRDLSFTVPPPAGEYSEDDHPDHVSARDRIQNLASSHLRHYVRRWYCEGTSGEPLHFPPFSPATIIDPATTLIPLFIQTLPQYAILESLHLQCMDIDTSTMSIISALNNLKSLHFAFVGFDRQLILPPPLPLREFVIHIGPKDDVLTWNSIQTTETVFSPGYLEKFTMKCSPNVILPALLCKPLVLPQPHNCLVQLSFSISNVQAVAIFKELLEASPLLRVLEFMLHESPDTGETFYDLEKTIKSIGLSRDACRLVNNLTSPPVFAPIFCPGRPISKFSMQSEDYDMSYHLFDVMVCLSGLDGKILTELKFEQTRTDDARDILPSLVQRFPNLKVLCMPINDLAEDEFSGSAPLYDDYTAIEDPDDIELEREQFEACYDDNDIDMEPDALLSFSEGYLRLLSDIAFGAIELPPTLVELNIPQNRTYKRLKFTKDHEFQLVHLFAIRSRAWENLQSLKIGMNNVYNQSWKKDSEGRWKKERYYFERNGRNMVGTACVGCDWTPTSDSGQYEFARGFLDVSEV